MRKAIAITLAVLGLAAIASAQDVNFNFDGSADFSKFKTYTWVDMSGGVKLDDVIARQIMVSFEAGLSKKGLMKVEGDNADLFIGYQVAIAHDKEIMAYGKGGFGYGPYWGGMGGMATATTSTLTNGGMSLDMYEVASKHLVWRGTATKTLNPNANPEKRQKNLHSVAARMLKHYPPKKNKKK